MAHPGAGSLAGETSPVSQRRSETAFVQQFNMFVGAGSKRVVEIWWKIAFLFHLFLNFSSIYQTTFPFFPAESILRGREFWEIQGDVIGKPLRGKPMGEKWPSSRREGVNSLQLGCSPSPLRAGPVPVPRKFLPAKEKFLHFLLQKAKKRFQSHANHLKMEKYL